ncbi:MAG TPA: flagellar biosynthesis protein FlhA [Nitrospirae bacterium]|nr:flagellar biosynthesis protein FlhA [bacterium BMS3Abin06]HDH13227.1 flagellar biosynthesis protein FlhA [Nitrospirota bacterium]HDZ01805.1 flagellar biosynthesis protein FlhA [Nitrospirota bacterium]
MKFLALLRNRQDIIVAVLMVSVIGVMILPVPPFLLDILLTLSISLSITILITSIYIKKPLEFSVLPSVLLMATLYRLSLNVATTRLILLKGNEGVDAAGQVIKSFGSFVVGGNYAVGIIIFLILVIVNFVVITKGSGRIAEVAARFTLDAMPGKQMAIDADLNSGLIDDAEARMRRELIAKEADYYGSMDGASKFVRGDAVAGLIITAINIIGGLIIGTLQLGMPVVDAATTYTILTIGDGLVSQIPALLISTASGIVVSRAGSDSDIGKDISEQVLVNPKVLVTVAGVLMALAFVPGLPHVPFFLISAASGGMAYILIKMPPEEEETAEAPAEPASEEPQIESFLELDPLSLEIGYGLIPLVDESSGELLGKIKAMRRQLASEFGFIVPPIHIKDNLQLRPHEYSFMIRGIEIAKGEVMMGHWLAVESGDAEKIEGIPTKEPAFGLPAYWIDKNNVEKAQLSGYMVVDPATIIGTHITELIREYSWELLTRAETQSLLDNISKTYPKIVEELIPANLTLGAVQRVLQNLLKERVPIKDIMAIFDTLLDYSPKIKDPEVLTEYVRQALSRTITKQYVNDNGRLPVFTLDPVFERMLSQAEGGNINPDVISRLAKSIEGVLSSGRIKGSQPVILCSSNIRRYLRKIVERISSAIVVLSSAEIISTTNLDIMGMVKYEN